MVINGIITNTERIIDIKKKRNNNTLQKNLLIDLVGDDAGDWRQINEFYLLRLI